MTKTRKKVLGWGIIYCLTSVVMGGLIMGTTGKDDPIGEVFIFSFFTMGVTGLVAWLIDMAQDLIKG